MNSLSPRTPTPAAVSEMEHIKKALPGLTPPGSGAVESEWENWGRRSAALIVSRFSYLIFL
jgi:hypothetical protein